MSEKQEKRNRVTDPKQLKNIKTHWGGFPAPGALTSFIPMTMPSVAHAAILMGWNHMSVAALGEFVCQSGFTWGSPTSLAPLGIT